MNNTKKILLFIYKFIKRSEKQRNRDIEKQRNRETERQRDRETEKQRDRESERQREKGNIHNERKELNKI